MDKDKVEKELCSNLLKWLQTFELTGANAKLQDITDGVAMAQALNQIAPEWFDDAWLSKIKTDVGNNWRLKVSNLKKIVQSIVDFYNEIFNQGLADYGRPDVMKIADQADPSEIARLLQLILGCAVNSERRQVYITKIMDLEESVQQVIMQSIQELETMTGPGPGPLSFPTGIDQQVQQLMTELQSVTEARDQMAQRCLELDMQVSLLQEEKASVLEEKKRIEERLQESVEDPVKGSGHFRRQVEALKEQVFKLETSRDDYRLKLEIQEKAMLELQSRLDMLQQTAGEARNLKDEVDVLRETADKVEKYEATIQSYKKKIDELGDLKRLVKLLESKNSLYIQQNVELEEELKKSGGWKAQVEVYKKQVADCEKKLSEETKHVDKLQFQCENLKQKLDAAIREKEHLIIERDTLREANEELQCYQFQNKEHVMIDSDIVPEDIAELKVQLVQLHHENKILKLNQKRPEDQNSTVIQSLLDDKIQAFNRMTLENRQLNQRIMELESEKKESEKLGEEDVAGLKSKLMELQEKQHCTKEELDEKVSLLSEKKHIIFQLQEALSQKDGELNELGEKYKKCMDKAKSVLKSLDPPSLPNSEMNNICNKLSENEKTMEEKEREFMKSMLIKDNELNLMATVFYHNGQSRQRESVEQRTAYWSNHPSFLSRMRAPTSRRNVQNFNSK